MLEAPRELLARAFDPL